MFFNPFIKKNRFFGWEQSLSMTPALNFSHLVDSFPALSSLPHVYVHTQHRFWNYLMSNNENKNEISVYHLLKMYLLALCVMSYLLIHNFAVLILFSLWIWFSFCCL